MSDKDLNLDEKNNLSKTETKSKTTNIVEKSKEQLKIKENTRPRINRSNLESISSPFYVEYPPQFYWEGSVEFEKFKKKCHEKNSQVQSFPQAVNYSSNIKHNSENETVSFPLESLGYPFSNSEKNKCLNASVTNGYRKFFTSRPIQESLALVKDMNFNFPYTDTIISNDESSQHNSSTLQPIYGKRGGIIELSLKEDQAFTTNKQNKKMENRLNEIRDEAKGINKDDSERINNFGNSNNNNNNNNNSIINYKWGENFFGEKGDNILWEDAKIQMNEEIKKEEEKRNEPSEFQKEIMNRLKTYGSIKKNGNLTLEKNKKKNLGGKDVVEMFENLKPEKERKTVKSMLNSKKKAETLKKVKERIERENKKIEKEEKKQERKYEREMVEIERNKKLRREKKEKKKNDEAVNNEYKSLIGNPSDIQLFKELEKKKKRENEKRKYGFNSTVGDVVFADENKCVNKYDFFTPSEKEWVEYLRREYLKKLNLNIYPMNECSRLIIPEQKPIPFSSSFFSLPPPPPPPASPIPILGRPQRVFGTYLQNKLKPTSSSPSLYLSPPASYIPTIISYPPYTSLNSCSLPPYSSPVSSSVYNPTSDDNHLCSTSPPPPPLLPPPPPPPPPVLSSSPPPPPPPQPQQQLLPSHFSYSPSVSSKIIGFPYPYSSYPISPPQVRKLKGERVGEENINRYITEYKESYNYPLRSQIENLVPGLKMCVCICLFVYIVYVYEWLLYVVIFGNCRDNYILQSWYYCYIPLLILLYLLSLAGGRTARAENLSAVRINSIPTDIRQYSSREDMFPQPISSSFSSPSCSKPHNPQPQYDQSQKTVQTPSSSHNIDTIDQTNNNNNCIDNEGNAESNVPISSFIEGENK
jgi:hypothetical protein